MLSEYYKSVLIDVQHRKLLSAFSETSLKEQAFPEENAWRWLHSQRHYGREVMLILSGSHSIQLNGRTYLGEPNTLVLINTRDEHDSLYYPGSEDSSHLWLFIKKKRITCQADTLTNGKFKILFQHIIENSEKAVELNRIWDAACSGMTDPELALFGIRAIINQIFFDLIGIEDLKEHGMSSRKISVMKAKNYIDNTLGRGCSIRNLSSLAGYSQVHFQRIFREIIGMSVGEYINQVRMAHFEELRNTCPLKAIAEDLGFSGLPAFCTWLKKNKPGR